MASSASPAATRARLVVAAFAWVARCVITRPFGAGNINPPPGATLAGPGEWLSLRHAGGALLAVRHQSAFTRSFSRGTPSSDANRRSVSMVTRSFSAP